MAKVLSRKDFYPFYRASDILGYEKIPLSAPNINYYGLVGEGYPLKKKKGTYRILVIGDSITEHNYYIEDLKKSLNNSGLKSNFEVWNAGCPGYNLAQYTNYLKYKGIRFSPDMLIIGFAPNDFTDSVPIFYKTKEGFIECYNPANNIAAKVNVNPFLLKHSLLYRFLIINLNNSFCARSKGNPDYFLREIKDICEKKHILFFGVLFPVLKPIEEYNEQEKSDYKNMVTTFRNIGIECVDLHKYFLRKDIDIFSLRESRQDWYHPSRLGHEIAAKAIYEYLLENHFAPSHSADPGKTRKFGPRELK